MMWLWSEPLALTSPHPRGSPAGWCLWTSHLTSPNIGFLLLKHLGRVLLVLISLITA